MKAICFIRPENIKVDKWQHICNCVSNFEDVGFSIESRKQIAKKDKKFKHNDNYAYVLQGKGKVAARILDLMIVLSKIEYFSYKIVDYDGE